jgi:5-methylcytosine-specific restriction endonuclease McrA
MRSSRRTGTAYLYKTKQWKLLRERQLQKQGMCECPHCKGAKLEANVVDHITPHKGDRKLFFNSKNLQSMAKECHDAFKQSQEKGGAGFLQGCDKYGNPLSREHEWYG